MVSGGVVVLHVAHLGSDAAYRHGACSAEMFLLKPVEATSAGGAKAGSVNHGLSVRRVTLFFNLGAGASGRG